MGLLELEIDKWANDNFGECQLGDARRTKRAVRFAAQVAAHPDGSTPQQTEHWSDCKAAYRMFDQEDVTFEALCDPHWRLTRQRTEGTWLLIGDTTHIDFGIQRELPELGPVGDGGGRGFLLHSSLMIDADTEEVAGLAGAELLCREAAPSQETVAQRKKRPRESEVWGRVIDLVGPPPNEARFIHVLDAGADNFEVFCHLQLQQCGWVVRCSQQQRVVLDDARERQPLIQLVQQQPVAGVYELSLRAKQKRPARTATLEVRFVGMRMPLPAVRTPFMKACGIKDIPMWVVEVREIDAPANVEPLHWVLLTSEPVTSFDAAWIVIGWYEKRPVIEDYHKCLKTGCRVEERQYATGDRLKRVTGLLSVVAVRLLQLRFVARTDPEQPAKQTVPATWLQMLQALRPRRRITTVRDFFRSLAMLGGFLGRKHDGEPGWLTIWRGIYKLSLCLRGAEAMSRKCG